MALSAPEKVALLTCSRRAAARLVVAQDYLHYIKKYGRFEKRHKNTPIHVSPAFRVKVGDEILAGQCRPLSKTVRFNMLRVIRSSGGKKAFDGM